MSDVSLLKKAAALKAVESVADGMTVGLGTGSTAAFAIEALGERVQQGLRITGIPTSNQSAELAKLAGIKLSDLETHPVIDVTIDGADEVERGTLYLIKGLGGALLHEKITALASCKVIIVVDDSKVTDILGTKAVVPVEIVAFGWNTTMKRLAQILPQASLTRRLSQNNEPFITDSGNYILDCRTGEINDAPHLESLISGVVGVVSTGLFLNVASQVIVAGSGGNISVLGEK